jgi:hypothetical protein
MWTLLLSLLSVQAAPPCPDHPKLRSHAVSLEVSGVGGWRWAAYTVGGAKIGAEVPLWRGLRAVADATLISSGARDIWLYDFESTRALPELGLGLRWQLRHAAAAPFLGAAFYAVPQVEIGARLDAGLRLFTDPSHTFAVHLGGSAFFSPHRPVGAEAAVGIVLSPGAAHPTSRRHP